MRQLIILAAFVFASISAHASINQYLGVWKNTNNNTRGITKIQIRKRHGKVIVKVWGKCHPTDCAWGRKLATPFAPNVSASELTSTVALTAVYDQGFSEKLITMKKRGRFLVAEVFANMNGRRSNYHNIHRFRRVRR